MSTLFAIDGKKIEFEAGETVLSAARRNGIDIPSLCSYEGFDNGACRLCMIEADSNGRMVPACSTRAAEGMNVETRNSRIEEYRHDLLAMLMRDHGKHPEAEGGKCDLERYAEMYSVKNHGTADKFEVSLDESHPGIKFDPNLCIMCRKCLIACDYDQVNEVIGITGRGLGARITFDLDTPIGESSCVSCGACVDSCPTGALIEKGWEPPERTVVSICPYCAVGCSVEYGIKDDRIIWARGHNGPETVNHGKLCVKGKFGFEFEMSNDRLKKPLIRRNIGERNGLEGRSIDEVFREASWDEALDLVASKLDKSMKKSGVGAIGGIACDRATNEDVFAFQKFMRATVGSDNVDQSATLCHAPSASMLSYATGAGASTNSVADIRNARTIMMVGSNVDRAHPVLSSEIKKAAKNGANLIIVDPRVVELSRHATMNMVIKPGSDVALFSAISKFILDNKLEDASFIQNRTEGFEQYRESLAPFTLEFASRITGIPEKEIQRLAITYATEKPSLIMWTLGITEHENGSDNVSSLINLALITGNVGKPGTGLNPIRGQNNVQGGADMGAVAGSLPGYQAFFDAKIRGKFKDEWKRDLPEFLGWKSTEMVEAAQKGRLKFLYITGENSVRTHPDTQKFVEALHKLDFLVVQDIFLTETAEYADVVLPAASSFEKSGTFTNTERRVQLIKPIFNPPGEAKPDWQIYGELAERLGYDLGFNSSSEIMDEIARLVPSYAGISHARLMNSGLQWPVKDPEDPGTSLLHVDKFIRGKGRFRIVGWRERDPSLLHSYPYSFIIGRQREHYHTATMTSRSSVIRMIETGSLLEMNPDDMKREKIADGEEIEVYSRNGKLRGKVSANEELPKGVIFSTFHYPDLNTNILTPSVYDEPTKTPAYKDTRVAVRKIEN